MLDGRVRCGECLREDGIVLLDAGIDDDALPSAASRCTVPTKEHKGTVDDRSMPLSLPKEGPCPLSCAYKTLAVCGVIVIV